LIDYADEAREQVRAFYRHYETLARDAAIRALADAEAKIERAPAKGLPASILAFCFALSPIISRPSISSREHAPENAPDRPVDDCDPRLQ
jgi:hypothetical protein